MFNLKIKKMVIQIEIEINDEPKILLVECDLVGYYKSGDLENPPEYPEFEVYSITDEDGIEFEPHDIDSIRIADLAYNKLIDGNDNVMNETKEQRIKSNKNNNY